MCIRSPTDAPGAGGGISITGHHAPPAAPFPKELAVERRSPVTRFRRAGIGQPDELSTSPWWTTMQVCRSFARLLRAMPNRSPMPPPRRSSTTPGTPDSTCLLLDIQLGGISGLELSRRLAAAGDLTVLFITAQDDPELRQQALEGDAPGFSGKRIPAGSWWTRSRKPRVSKPHPLEAPMPRQPAVNRIPNSLSQISIDKP